MNYQSVPTQERQEAQSDKARTPAMDIARKIFRILFLLLILAIVVFVPIFTIGYISTQTSTTVSTALPLKFNLRYCKLYISEQSSISPTTIQIGIYLPGTS